MLEWMDQAQDKELKQNEILSFQDYMDVVEKNPFRECRPSYQYLKDMLDYYGKSESGALKLFETEHPDSPPVYGQSMPEQMIYSNLSNFVEEGMNNKFILLVGPNGSSKSSIVRKLMRGAEEYSKTEDGALYSFSWIFPIDTYVKGTLGLNVTKATADVNSYAHLEDKDISAILTSELKDHPLLLIPREYRQALLEDLLEDFPELLETVKKSYLFKGDISKRNRMIYDALLKNYKGNHKDVLKHIRVERFKISRRYSSSAVTIEPQLHVDARMQQITMDKRLGSLPPSLQSLNLFSLQGEAVSANRGILEFSDLLKRPLDTFKYLLQTMETGSLNLQGILTELDIFFIGTSNEVHLAAFKQHPDFNSFKGRFNFVKVPYLLNYKDEAKIYKEQIEGLKEKTSFEPHALEAICYFAIMTRLRQPQVKNYPNKKLANITTNLNPMEKLLFIAEDTVPEKLDSDQTQTLRANKKELLNEFHNENLYEGKFGISPRDIKNIIYRLSSENKTITFIEVIDYLRELIQLKSEYDFLNMSPQADYHHPARFLDLIKGHCMNQFDQQLRDGLGMVDNRSYEEYIRRYIENINALLKGEKIKNKVTGKYEESDEYFIREFEKNIELKEKAEDFRSHLISKLGAFYLDNPGVKISYMKVFPDVVRRLKESFRKEQKKVIKVISSNIVYYESEIASDGKESKNKKTPLTKENRDLIQKVISNLTSQYSYSEEGAITLMKALIKDRY